MFSESLECVSQNANLLPSPFGFMPGEVRRPPGEQPARDQAHQPQSREPTSSQLDQRHPREYPQGRDLTAKHREFREQVRLSAIGCFEAGSDNKAAAKALRMSVRSVGRELACGLGGRE